MFPGPQNYEGVLTPLRFFLISIRFSLTDQFRIGHALAHAFSTWNAHAITCKIGLILALNDLGNWVATRRPVLHSHTDIQDDDTDSSLGSGDGLHAFVSTRGAESHHQIPPEDRADCHADLEIFATGVLSSCTRPNTGAHVVQPIQTR